MSEALRIKSYELVITGQVQGVGFRPFIYRIAKKYHLKGWVKNCSGEVITLVQGDEHQFNSFKQAILNQHPPLAIPLIDSIKLLQQNAFDQFTIEQSARSEQAQRHIPPDFFTCNDCLDEISTPQERRYRYPFINCTQCGPRYTIIKDLPYDRPNTSLSSFPLCHSCNEEYIDTLDRRFHAQPLACAECGPELSFVTLNDNKPEARITGNEAALLNTVNLLKQGGIIAVKGVGGYHLICDATNEQAVLKLRQRKNRPDKPLAVMFSTSDPNELKQLNRYCDSDQTDSLASASPFFRKGTEGVENQQLNPLSPPLKKGEANETAIEKKIIVSAQRPIVLINAKKGLLAPSINPGLHQVGAMLAYSPLHYLILKDFGLPIVATSGNLSGEPVLTDNHQAEHKLNAIADAFLQHNRPILRPADDSVIRIIHNKKRLFRIGRGFAPLEFNLPFTIKQPVLAVGGQMKNTIALAWNNRVVISPHIGELDSKRSSDVFSQVIDDLCHLYRVHPEQIICDTHPGYFSTRYAEKYAKEHDITLSKIQHHKAHAGIVWGDFFLNNGSFQDNSFQNSKPWLVFSWDGTGLGDDQTLWGAEGFYGRAGHWQRVTTIKPFYLQGGDKAAKEPWRSACALLWENNRLESGKKSTQYSKQSYLPDKDHYLLSLQAWKNRINTIQSSSMGRLFDAASAFLGLGAYSSFEGQGPMLLETKCHEFFSKNSPVNIDFSALPLYKKNNLCIADWSELLPLLMNNDDSSGFSVERRAYEFHIKIAETLIAQAQKIKSIKGDFRIGLSGGVFQNKFLSEYILKRLEEENFAAFLPEKVPYNDAGLAFGQVIEGHFQEQHA